MILMRRLTIAYFVSVESSDGIKIYFIKKNFRWKPYFSTFCHI